MVYDTIALPIELSQHRQIIYLIMIFVKENYFLTFLKMNLIKTTISWTTNGIKAKPNTHA